LNSERRGKFVGGDLYFFLKGIGFDRHEMFFQQDGTQPHTANTDADIVNTYFRDGITSNRSIPWSVWSRARSWPSLLTLSFVFIFFCGAF
jgi:hypothetical protein